MIGRRIVLVVVALTIASLSCQPAAPEAGPLSDADVAAIRGVLDSLVEAEVAGDWDAVATSFAEDAVFMFPDQPAVQGLAAWRAFVDQVQPSVQDLTIDIADIDGRGDLAYVRGSYSETMAMGEAEPEQLAGKFLWVMKKQADGSWLCTVTISNSDLPAADSDT